MNTLQEYIQSINKQNQTMKSVFGHNPLQNLADAIKRHNQTNLALSGLSGITDIARSISQQMKQYNKSSILVGNTFKNQMSSLQIPKSNYAFMGLASSLSEIAKTNQLLSNKLAGFATSQLMVTNSLSEIVKSINQSHLSQFNSLSIALQGISNTYIKNIAWTKNWEDFNIAEEANETISSITDEVINNQDQLTQADLDNLRTSILVGLSGLLEKTRTEKARQFIINLITVIGFLLTFYGTYQLRNDKSNSDVVIEVKKEIEKINSDLLNQIETALNKLNKTRIARTNVNLRKYPKKNGRIIGLVKSGQKVSVIEIRHKYLLISYIDKDTDEPKSGFVVKKYFDLEKIK